MRFWLERAGYRTVEFVCGRDAVEHPGEPPAIACVDLGLGDVSGIEVIRHLRALDAEMPTIVVTAQREVETAVAAMRAGAYDYVTKPLDCDRLLHAVGRAKERRSLALSVKRLRSALGEKTVLGSIVGQSRPMRELAQQVTRVLESDVAVCIFGESGTGKELVARAIHNGGPRKHGPFVAINCAGIPESLQESELFGHERGAFTGAAQRKRGMFELADKGTLFLDEIGDMSPSAQAKVLRALQSGEITRVGSESTISVDVRIIAATNKDLETEVAEGRFREDLYFRLNVVPIRSPSLRERKSDIPQLAQAFLRTFCRENGMREKTFTPELLGALTERPWPGNVRELKNVVERMAILGGDPLDVEDLPEVGRLGGAVPRDSEPPWTPGPSASGGRKTLKEFREEAEKKYILEVLEEVGWNISRAASELGVERTNLHKKIRHYGIKRESA